MLERTPFYAEQGGQAADTGSIASTSSRFAVHDTRVCLLPGLASSPVSCSTHAAKLLTLAGPHPPDYASQSTTHR